MRFWLGFGWATLVTVTVGCAAQPGRSPTIETSQIAIEKKSVGVTLADGAGQAPIAILEETDDPNKDTSDVLGPDAIRPCDKGTPEHKGAEAALATLASKIYALDDKASPKKLTEEISSLLATPCFELARRDFELIGDTLEFDSGLALKTWWTDGERWLRDYESLTTSRWMSMPGTPRHSLFLENHKTNPLAPLLCPATPGDCGKETTGWMRRTESTFTRHAARRLAEENCEEKVKKKDVAAASKYATFLECKKNQIELREALPLGRFKAPTDGLFVIEGRSLSSHNNCKELRIYDLANGATQIVEDCPVHSYVSHGPPPKTGPKVISGKVPVAALREALWMVMLASTVDEQMRGAEMFHIPEGVAIGRPAEEHLSLHGFGRCGGGHRLVRPWSWMRKSPTTPGAMSGQVSGILVTPGFHSDATDHAGELMGVFEDGFVEGCSPRMTATANAVAWSKPGTSISKNEPKVELDKVETEPLRLALAQATAAPSCPALP